MAAAVSIAVLLALGAHPASSVPRPKSVELTGQVKEVGAGGLKRSAAVLAANDGEQYTMHAVTSEGAEELKRLAGVKIAIRGVKNDPRLPRGRHILVEHYEIVDVGKGVVPRIGVIAKVDVGGKSRLLFVDDKGRADPLPSGWSKKMTRHVGAKVWMVGVGEGESFKPRRFSILRAPRKE